MAKKQGAGCGLDGLRRALETLHLDQRHIARRNARRRVFGELLKLKHVQRDFPNVTPWPEGWPTKPAKHPTAGKRWHYVEYRMLKPRRSWSTPTAQRFVNAWAAKIGRDPLTVAFNLLGNTTTIGLPVEHLQEADRRRKPLGAS